MGTICRCALEKGRVLHRGDCALYPGEPLRIRLDPLPDPCPECSLADLEPRGGKMRCARYGKGCDYIQPCCNP